MLTDTFLQDGAKIQFEWDPNPINGHIPSFLLGISFIATQFDLAKNFSCPNAGQG
ncbi:hypothetical protein [Pseudomonas fluorescens]|uniref:hypothetical protein n=1 Tax=Pseudomonas fluorescens TaxID=294 RepID=UPI00177EF11E|nr:hypothetical protein [Pseudomonas fluorescens]